jgi:mono/diheme cytochrome c family protein
VKRRLAVMVLLAGAFGGRQVLAADAAQLARGQQLFEQRCGVCHREGQTGTQILARRLGKEHSLLAARSDLSDPYIRRVVRWGLNNMPRLTRVELPEGELDDVVAYLTRERTPNAVP